MNQTTLDPRAVLLKGLNGNRFLFPQWEQIKPLEDGSGRVPMGGWRLSSGPLPEPWAPGRSGVGCSPQPAGGCQPSSPSALRHIAGQRDADPTFSNTKAFYSSFVVLSRTSQGNGAGRRGRLFFWLSVFLKS